MNRGRLAFWSLLSVCCVAGVGHAQPMGCDDSDLIVVGSRADSIFVSHENATKNCCTLLTVDVTSENFVVDFVEGDAGDFCACMCCFNLKYGAHGFQPGRYLVRVWYLGELVGEGEVDVVGPGEALALGTVAKGECRTLASAPDAFFRVTTWGRMRTDFLTR